MGHRLTRIVTKTGDAGTTGLGDGSRVSKGDPRVAAMGEVDELNCCLGLLLAQPLPARFRQTVTDLQHDLFDLGAELCIPDRATIDQSYVARLERLLAEFNADLPPLKEFVLPGGSAPAVTCHLARAVCRRAERALWTLTEKKSVNSTAGVYLNRLSDLLFVIARSLARSTDSEVIWDRERHKE